MSGRLTIQTPGRTTRVRGLAPWRPQRRTLELVDTIKQVLVEYAEYLPLTIRQIFYRLVGVHDFPKTEHAYKNLAEKLNRARRAGIIPFDAIRDDGIVFNEPLAWDGPRELIATFQHHAETFRLDRQVGQDRWLVVATEAVGMVPQIQRLTDPFGIPVASGGGFDSLTAKYDQASRFGLRPVDVEVLHIGDYDTSGKHIFSSLMEDVQALARDLGHDTTVGFTRLAVTREQIDTHGLPTAPPKETDRRSFDDTETTQAEALPPDALAEIVRDAIDNRVDRITLNEVFAREAHIRERLSERLKVLFEDWDAP